MKLSPIHNPCHTSESNEGSAAAGHRLQYNIVMSSREAVPVSSMGRVPHGQTLLLHTRARVGIT